MNDLICNIPQWQHLLIILIAQLIFMSIEYWMGKTDKTKSGSLLELILNVVKLIITKSWRK